MNKTTDEFLTGSIPKVVIKNALPAVIAMLMVIVYNFADTVFISLTKNDYQMAAVSMGAPVFMIFMSLGTLFGVGGTSVISRALGNNDEARAKNACSFCMWASAAIGVVLTVVLWLFCDKLAVALGATENSFEYSYTYLKITIGCGAFSMVSNCLSNLLRSEGKAMNSMTGTLIGNLLNIVLDALFVIAFGWGVMGVAIATVIGNIVACLYYLVFYMGGKSQLSIKLSDFSMKGSIIKDVFAIGISASLANLLVSLVTIVVNIELTKYDELFVPAYGVASKLLMIVSLIAIGISAGVQPILGFCYGAKEKDRFMKYLRFSVLFCTGIALVVAILCFVFARPIVDALLTEKAAMDAGLQFTKILLLTVWLTGALVTFQNTLQAMGKALPALLSSLIKQGILFAFLFVLKSIIGYTGIIWAQPVSDVLSVVITVIMLEMCLKKTKW